jgi:RHS repeat-associated protein
MMRRTHSDRLSGQYRYRLDRNGTKTSKLPYYDPALHRFIQADTVVPDPNNPQSLNWFTYVNSNPARYFDPKGYKKVGWFPVGNVIVQPKQVYPSPILLVLQMSVLTVHRMRIFAWTFTWSVLLMEYNYPSQHVEMH